MSEELPFGICSFRAYVLATSLREWMPALSRLFLAPIFAHFEYISARSRRNDDHAGNLNRNRAAGRTGGAAHPADAFARIHRGGRARDGAPVRARQGGGPGHRVAGDGALREGDQRTEAGP